ncbi:unnamed protein product, partial [Sphacelaria rigidula]
GPGGRFGSGRGIGGGRGVFAGGRGIPRPSPWDGMDRSSQPCVFFAQEKCTKGDACPFSHADAGAGNEGSARRSTQASHASHTPQGTTDVSAGLIEAHPIAPVASSPEARYGENLHSGSAQPPKGSPNPTAALGSVPSPGSPPLMLGPDGTMYVIGPDGPVPLDAVVRTMGARAGSSVAPSGVSNQTKAENPSRNGQSPAPSSSSSAQNLEKKGDAAPSLHTSEKAPSQGGVIALPDGGFITRKRAAEMHLRDGSSESQVRHVRQRELGKHEKPRPQHVGVPESRVTAAGSSRGSIMDRLGPARPTQGRSAIADRANAPSGLARHTRSTGRREEGRAVHAAVPAERQKLSSQTPISSVLSMPQALGTTRQSRRADGGREEGGSVAKTLGNSTTASKSSSLNFKVPTLDEIKRKKAKAARGAKKATIFSAHQNIDGNRAGRPAENADVAPQEVSTPDLAKVSVSPLAAERPSGTQLHAADLDEFSEWL